MEETAVNILPFWFGLGRFRGGVLGRALCVLAVTLFFAEIAAADLTRPVSGHRASGKYGWDYGYTVAFDGSSIIKDVQIDFKFQDGWTDKAMEDWKNTAEKAIEAQWNNRYKVRDTDTGETYGVGVDVTFDGYVGDDMVLRFDQTVKVWEDGKIGDGAKDPTRTNMSNWQWGDTGSIMSHEFGHMLGLYDEYEGGAIDPGTKLIDKRALMGNGALTSNPTMPERYFEQFIDHAGYFLDGGTYSLVYIPAPGACFLGLIGLILVRTRKLET